MTRGAAPAAPSIPVPGTTWLSLHGLWEFEQASAAAGTPTNPVPFGRKLNGSILVPFPPESCLSGVGAFENYPTSTPNFTFTYSRLVFDYPLNIASSSILSLEACDWNCTVWLNGKLVVSHQGGYDGFSAVVSTLLHSKDNELIVFAHDPTEEGSQPQGKQLTLDILNDHVDGNKYCPSSSIWGEVWIESAPSAYISNVQLRTNESAVFVWLELSAGAATGASCAMNVSVSLDGAPVTSAVFPCAAAIEGTFLHIPSPQVWAPGAPILYDADVYLLSAGLPVDAVRTYFGLRGVGLRLYERPAAPALGPLANTSLGGVASLKIVTLKSDAVWEDCMTLCQSTAPCTAWIFSDRAPHKCTLKAQIGLQLIPDAGAVTAGKLAIPAGPAARPTLNGEFTFRLAYLDQSWWPDGAYRAPTDEALAFDILAAPALGFNAIRAHTKVNSKRWYYHADRLGVVVMQDAVQKFGGEGVPLTEDTVPLFMKDFKAMIDGRGSSPAIVQINIFNEGDCVSAFNVSDVVNWAAHYDGLLSPHGLLGAGRIIDTNTGGPANALLIGDVNDVHSYPEPAVPMPSRTQFSMVGEFSGLGWFPENEHQWKVGKCYAYSNFATPAAFVDTYCNYVQNLALESLFVSGAVATQLTDLECECDGFWNYDRSAKFSDAEAAQIIACNKALIASAGK